MSNSRNQEDSQYCGLGMPTSVNLRFEGEVACRVNCLMTICSQVSKFARNYISRRAGLFVSAWFRSD